jgi:serine/threonine-protein kinase
MIGSTLSRYHILEQIGAGGMGVVYRARDERLQRDVALKVISPGLIADDAARRRFRKEALALSQLSHGNIAVVHDFDSHEGTDFLVMEYIPGVTLDQRVASGPMPEPELARLAVQMAEGLAAAHGQGVVHRDLKPGNLRITPDGRLKVLDFGLARMLDAGSLSTTVSDAHPAAGTLAYMAPEVLGGQPASEGSDIYSLGIVLYEMATGRRPFKDESALALMYAVLNSTPPAPRSLNAAISARLDAIILRAIDRDPERRYARAADLLAELKTLAAAADPSSAAAHAAGEAGGRERIESLAVLPLENLSGDPAQEFFVDGMTEALIADLAKIGTLRVISRTSVMRFKGVRRPLPEIARELRVDAIMEGTVVRGGDRVRISAQLIDARTDTHLWAQSYERPMSDVLALQSEVARAVATEVQVKLSPQADARLGRAHRVDPEAHDAYLRGRYCWNRRGEEDLRRAVDYFRSAIDRDPAYALAYVGLADAYNLQGFFTYVAPKEAFPRARAAALKALEMDDGLAEAHVSLAYATFYHDWDWEAAEAGFRRAIAMNPNYSVGHQWYMNLLSAQGRFDEALREALKTRELDPLSIITSAAIVWCYYYMRDPERASAQIDAAIEMDPKWPIGYLWSAWVHQLAGRHDEAVGELEKAVALSGGVPLMRAFLAHGLAAAGRREEAATTADAVLELSATRYVSPYVIALVWAALGDKDRAFAWLEKALDDRAHWLVFLDVDPRLDPLRSDSRFAGLRRRVGPAR